MAEIKPAGVALPPKARFSIPSSIKPKEPEENEPAPEAKDEPATLAKSEEHDPPAPEPVIREEPVLVVEDPTDPPRSDVAGPARWLVLAGLALLVLNLALLGLVALLWLNRDPVPAVITTESVLSEQTEPTTVTALPSPAEPEEPTDAVQPPREIAEPAPLHIAKMLLARSVSGFGLYEPIPDTPLRARHVPFIHVYVEMENPQPEIRRDGRHIYQFSKAIRLFRSDIGPAEPLMDTAVSFVISGQSPRRDFHASQALQTTRRLTPGEYTLVVRITDTVSGQIATRDTTFTIHPE